MDTATAQRLHWEIQDDLAAGRVDAARQKVTWATRELQPDIAADRRAGRHDVADQKARWVADLQRQVDAAAPTAWPSVTPSATPSYAAPAPQRRHRWRVGRILGFGCLGIIGLVVLLGVVAALGGGNRSDQTTTASGGAKPATAPTAPVATPVPAIADIRPNELGSIMVLEYHVIGDEELRWTRTRENFRKDLEYLYRNGYHLTAFSDLLDNRVRVPAGKAPVVLTFDDSNRSQFQFIAGPGGALKVDPRSGLGILEAFIDEHPDFGRAAVFCILPGADPPNDLFGQPEYRQQKLQYLVRQGYEICNHTLWHARLDQVDAKETVRQLGLTVKAVQDAVPGYQVSIFNPPGGVYPKDLSPVLEGAFEGVSYRHRAILEVSGGPMKAPNHRELDFLHVPRVQAISSVLEHWFRYFEQHPEERYVSDGDPDRLVFPAAHLAEYRSAPGTREEPSTDPNYKVIRLRSPT